MTRHEIIDETSSASPDGQLDGGGVRLVGQTSRKAFQAERNLDGMFGEESPRQFVAGPNNLWVAPELAEKMPAADARPPPRLVVDVSGQIEQQQKTDFVRWFARWFNWRPSLPVSALFELENYLRVAIEKKVAPADRRELSSWATTTRKAAEKILRFINKAPPSHKAKEDEADGWGRAIEWMRRVRLSEERRLYYLFQDEPIQFRCENSQFDDCLTIISDVRANPAKNLTSELDPHKDRFVADLERIRGLAKAYASNRLTGWLRKNRMWSAQAVCALIVFEASERPNTFALRLALSVNFAPLSHGEEHRLRIIEKWSAELLCTLIIMAGFAWCDPSRWSRPLSTVDTEVLRLRKPAGGPAHDRPDDDAHEFWIGYINAAKRAPRMVWSAVLGSTPAGRMILEAIPENIASMPRSERGAWYGAPQTTDAQWVVKVKRQMLDCLRDGRANSAVDLAREFNLRSTLAERLFKELQEEL
jgi:hypothetical protein